MQNIELKNPRYDGDFFIGNKELKVGLNLSMV